VDQELMAGKMLQVITTHCPSMTHPWSYDLSNVAWYG